MKSENEIYNFFDFIGGTTRLTSMTFVEGLRKPLYFGLIVEQIAAIGVRSFPLVFIVSTATGMVMALQFGVSLEKFGGKLYIPKIVSLSMVRELGPVFSCLMIAARAGAGITSEIGSMKVTQQIDAIRALGTSPIKRIVAPRVFASLIAVPLLSTFATLVGILGGMVIGVYTMGLDLEFYIYKIIETISLDDFYSGFFKTPVFAFLISITACFYGLTVSGGTQGVGSSTTKSVVVSSILIVVSDFFLTKLFILFGW